MPKLPLISGKKLIKLLVIDGFTVVSQKGSHIKLTRDHLTVIVPNYSEVKKGTLSNILKLTNLNLNK